MSYRTTKLRVKAKVDNREPSSTKTGPGRKHVQGTKYGTAPTPDKGAWLGLHEADEEKRTRRALIALIGVRQFKRSKSAPLRALRDAA